MAVSIYGKMGMVVKFVNSLKGSGLQFSIIDFFVYHMKYPPSKKSLTIPFSLVTIKYILNGGCVNAYNNIKKWNRWLALEI